MMARHRGHSADGGGRRCPGSLAIAAGLARSHPRRPRTPADPDDISTKRSMYEDSGSRVDRLARKRGPAFELAGAPVRPDYRRLGLPLERLGKAAQSAPG